MVLNVSKGGFQVGCVELIRDAESKRPILSPFLHNRMEEAYGKRNVSPLLVRFDFFKEVLVDHGRIGTC